MNSLAAFILRLALVAARQATFPPWMMSAWGCLELRRAADDYEAP